MGIVYASRNRQERKGGVRWNRLSNRCQTIRSSPLLGFRQGVKDGSARTAAEHLPSGSCRLIPLRPGPVAVRVAVQGRARQFLRSLNPRKRQHSAEGVGFEPTESCALSGFQDGRPETQNLGLPNVLERSPRSPSRLIPPHPVSFRPVGCTRGVRDASTSMNVKPALTSGRGRGSHLVEEAERVHAIRTYSSASWSGSGSAPHERGPRRRRRPPDVLVPSRDG